MEQKCNDQGKSKLSYGSIFIEPIHPSIPIKDFPYKFEVLKMHIFIGKEDPKQHLRKFNYSCYIIANDDVLMLRNFPMMLYHSSSRYLSVVVTRKYPLYCKYNNKNILRITCHKQSSLRKSRSNWVTSNYARRIMIKIESVMKTIKHSISNYQFKHHTKSIK